MNIIYVRRVDEAGGFAEHGKNQFQSHFVVKTDSVACTRSQILLCGLLPVYGGPHPENTLARCCKVDAQRHRDNPLLWNVTVEWNTDMLSRRDPADDQKQPDLRRAKWSANFVNLPLSRFTDLKGVTLMDKAGNLFDPVPDVPIVGDQITIRRYEASCDRAWQRTFANTANSDAWMGNEAGEALMLDIKVDEEYTQGAYWFVTVYEILIKPKIKVTLPIKGKSQTLGGWDPEYVLNAGPKCLVGDGVGNVTLKTPNDDFYDGRPVLLTQSGFQIERDKTTGAYKDDPYFLEFTLKNTAAFSDLDLIPPSGWIGA